jgi:hypothetical protein
VGKTKKVKIRLFGLFRPKDGLFRHKEDQLRNILSKISASDQGLIKQTHLAALLSPPSKSVKYTKLTMV